MILRIRDRTFEPAAYPLVMGILNVTPDSFSDGGQWFDCDRAVERALQMIAEGADIIDVGPESTRPGADEIPAQMQIERAIPVIREVRRRNHEIPISIDTRIASVAERAIDAGADIVNDISAMRDDPAMVSLVARKQVPIVLMHRQGKSATMQVGGGPRYDNVIDEICSFLSERRDFAIANGVDPSRIIFDPGIGFGKRIEHNLLIMKHVTDFISLGQPVLVGASKKKFIGDLLAPANPAAMQDPQLRHDGSLACAALAAVAGATIVRVHDVEATCNLLRVIRGVREVEA